MRAKRFWKNKAAAVMAAFLCAAGLGAVSCQSAPSRQPLDVPFISQAEAYPTGCESVSTVMACRYAGISIDVETFIDSYLPKDSFIYENGVMMGSHPDTAFMGDPYTDNGFGCYAPCIEKAVRGFLPEGYVLKNTTSTGVPELCRKYIDAGIPVILWATMYMKEPTEGA